MLKSPGLKILGLNSPGLKCSATISKATFQSERTTHISLLSLFQTLGFVLGPAIQSALSPIGETVYVKPESDFIIDMYTATG